MILIDLKWTLHWIGCQSLSLRMFVLPSLSKFVYYSQSASPSENKLALVWAGGTSISRNAGVGPNHQRLSAHVVRFVCIDGENSIMQISRRPSLVLRPQSVLQTNLFLPMAMCLCLPSIRQVNLERHLLVCAREPLCFDAESIFTST